MAGYIFLLFALVGANCYQWNGIEILKAKLNGYKSASDRMSKHARDQLERISEEADGFITHLGNISMVEAVLQLPDDDACKKNFTLLQELKNSYKIYLSNNQRDLMNWLSDIETKFIQANSEVFSYQNIADGMIFYPNLTMSNYTKKINLWLEDKLNSLKCRLVTRCSVHVVSKRYASDHCGENLFFCHSINRCINGAYVCDGQCDCNPCDDESDNCSRYCFGGFHCNNLRCIKKEGICNGIDDCGDGSDEKGCPTEFSVERGNFHCDNGLCIGLGKVCDGKTDCADGSDEGGLCGQTSCENSCSARDGICLGTPRGNMCLSHCPPGTSETSAGCLPQANPSATIFEMLEDFPRLMTRYQALNKWLQRKTVAKLANSTLGVFKCIGGIYYSLNNIILIDSFNSRTTHRPNNPTQNMETTTEHPVMPVAAETVFT